VNDAKQNILSYINNLGIGNTVVRNRIIALAFVSGVKDFTLLLPVGDVIIPDGTLARSTVSNIVIS
jgi:phage-related baseplate assembly protein